MDDRFTLRAATPDDADAIAAVHVLAWQVGYRGLIDEEYLDGLDVAEWAARTRNRMAAADQAKAWLVAESSGEIIGFSSFGTLRPGRGGDGAPGEGEVHAIYVHPDHWGIGVGRRLLDAVVRDLSTRGLTPVRLWTPIDNHHARRFYERNGFTADITGEFRMPHGDEEIVLPIVRYTKQPSCGRIGH